jgi:hypothetical protein
MVSAKEIKAIKSFIAVAPLILENLPVLKLKWIKAVMPWRLAGVKGERRPAK